MARGVWVIGINNWNLNCMNVAVVLQKEYLIKFLFDQYI